MEVKEDLVLKRVKEVIEHGTQAIGKQQFIDLCYGDRLQTLELIKAYCYDCMGFYADGIGDCKNSRCPLYSKMPYNLMPHSSPGLTRGKKISRNPLYPMDKRLRSEKSQVALKHDMPKPIAASMVARKLKSRKYPQEITQKAITHEERETAMFDAAIEKYEKEKKENENNKHK